jgi:hypothetical protein
MEIRVVGVGLVSIEELEARLAAYVNAGAPKPILEGSPQEQREILEAVATRGDSQIKALVANYVVREPRETNRAHGHVAAVHNMLLVGGHSVFLSHLPMFMPPHDAQVIIEATFIKDGKNADALYFADRATHPSLRFYTVQPEPFAIEELFQAEPARPLRTSFTATVFRGHLEKGGTTVDALAGIEVEVTRVVHAHRFVGAAKSPILTYVLFGDAQELFMAHLISQAPDFDQIVQVIASGSMPSAEELARGVTIEVVDVPNTLASRLKVNVAVPVRGHVAGAHQFFDLTVTVKAELYFEEGELSSSRMSGKLFEQTAEEKKAGFD